MFYGNDDNNIDTDDDCRHGNTQQLTTGIILACTLKTKVKMKVITHETPLMLVNIGAKYGKNPFRPVPQTCKADTTRCALFSSFVANSWLGDLEDIDKGQMSLPAIYCFLLGFICVSFGKS